MDTPHGLGHGRRLAVVVALSLAFTMLSLSEIPPADNPTEMWAPLAAAFVWATVVWDGGPRTASRLTGHLLVQVAIFVAIAAGFGWGFLDAVWMGASNVAAGTALALAYARVRRGPHWAPTTALDNLALLSLAAAAAGAVALLGGFPHLEIGELDRLTLWGVIRSTVYTYVGGVTLLGILSGPARAGPLAPRWAAALLFPLGAVCLWLTYLDPELPLTWFLLLPAVVAGSVLSLRGAAVYSLFVAIGAALATLHPINQFGYDGFVPGSVIIDLLLTVSTFITIHLAILRHQQAVSARELERERHEANEQAALLGTVFETMSDGLVVLDRQRRVVLHNAAARHLVGRPIPVGRAMNWSTHLGLHDLDHEPIADDELPWGDRPDYSPRQLILDHDGAERVINFRSWPLAKDAGRTLVLFSDVTAQKARLSELTSFAGVVAHDLRGPLSSLHGWLELAEDAVVEEQPESATEFLARARLNSERMRQVIEDWLAYTVQRDGSLTTTAVPLAGLLKEITAPYAATDADLSPQFALDVDHVVEADRVLTRQLIANLIGNAVKYTHPGQRAHVTITSRPDDEPGFIRVEVGDRGIGLPPGEEERVFEEFHRAAAHADTFSGTGLGLSLCRRIVTRHGGSIEARTNTAGGATFSFTLPAG